MNKVAYSLLAATLAVSICCIGIGSCVVGSICWNIASENPNWKPVEQWNGKPVEQWNYQDIQDHLAAKGFRTDRGDGRRGMWFMPANGTGRLTLDEQTVLDEFGPYLKINGYDWAFLVNDLGSSANAQREVERIRDVQQRDAIAKGRFVFRGNEKPLRMLRELLP
jgi:hypothetical protein